MATPLGERGLRSPANQSNAPLHDVLKPVLQACQRRVRSWRVPPNWAPVDWFEEIEAIEAVAGWQAERDFDPFGSSKVEAFVYQRVMARALARYRQEWTYALHFVPEGEAEERANCGHRAGQQTVLADESATANAAHEVLLDAVASLAEPQQLLLKQLFWDGYTEAELGVALAVSQRAVSKRKQAIIKSLRDHLCDLQVTHHRTTAGKRLALIPTQGKRPNTMHPDRQPNES
jgi:RNA polymerase sigma factor (sigma-70 family)